MILPHIITQNTCRMRPPVKKETEAYVTKAWWWWKKEKKDTGETLTVCELLCVKVAEWKKNVVLSQEVLTLHRKKKKDRDTPELQVDTQDSWRNNWCRVANKENSPSATAVFVNRPRDVEKHNQVDLWITVRVWRQSCGRPGGNKEGTGEKRKRRDKERERIPPVLTSAPETRNGCKPVLKKGREVWEGELEGSQKAYLKDLSCMVT